MSAIALAKNVTSGDKRRPSAIWTFGRRWLRLANRLTKRAGVDLTTAEAMQATFDLFAKTLDEIEALLAK